MGIFTRKARDAKDVFRIDLGGQPRGFTFTPDTPRQSLEAIARRYARYVWLCTDINGRVAASVRPRLFMLGNKNVVEKCERLRPKPLDRATKSFLQGRREIAPSVRVTKRIQGNIDDMTEVTAHPLLDLLDDVNPWTEGFSYRKSLYIDLQLFGRLFTLLTRQGSEPPMELWRLQPQYMDVLPSRTNFIGGFRYKRGVEEKTYTPDEVFWVKLFDPHSPWGGVGWVEAFIKTIDADLSIVDFTEWMFRNGGTPDLVVTTAVEPSEEEKRAYRRDFRTMFGNLRDRVANLLWVSGKDTKVESFAHAPRDMEYVKGREIARDEVCAAAGVPKSYVTTDDVNLANAREGSITHMRITVWPLIQTVEEAINQRLLPLWSDRLILIHDNPISEDREIRIAERASQLGAGYSVNELRIQDGEEPLDDPKADMPMIAAGLVPLSMAGMDLLGRVGRGADGESLPMGEAETPTAGDELASTNEASPQAGAIETTEATVLNGAQVTAATAIVVAVTAGEIPRDAGIGQLEVLFNLTNEQAERIMGSAGKPGIATTPNENPKETERAEREAEANQNQIQSELSRVNLAYRRNFARKGRWVTINGNPVFIDDSTAEGGDGASGGNIDYEGISKVPDDFFEYEKVVNPREEESDESSIEGASARYKGNADQYEDYPIVHRGDEYIIRRLGEREFVAFDDGKAIGYVYGDGSKKPSGGQIALSVDVVGKGIALELSWQLRKRFPLHGSGGLTEGGRAVLRKVHARLVAVKSKNAKAVGCEDHDHGAELSHKALWETKDDKPKRDEGQRRADEREKEREESPFSMALRLVFAQQVKELIQAMSEMGVTISIERAVEILSQPKWTAALADAARPHIERMVLQGGVKGLERLGLEVSFEAANPRVQEFVDQSVTRLASTAQQTTTVAVRDLLGDGLQKGETIAQLRERVRAWAEGDPATGRIGTVGYRAETIARTESARAYERGQEVAWKESGVVTGKLWLAAPGACEFCQSAAAQFNEDAKAVPLGASFFAKGTTLRGTQGGTLRLDYEAVEGPPLHPNCTCSLLAVMSDGGTE